MADNSQKTPLVKSLNEFAVKKAQDQIQLTGKALPCSVLVTNGWIVTVKFEVQDVWTLPQVTVPVASSVYDYLPLQKGDFGVVVPADAYLGGISGLGGGVADISLQANLSPLIFVPIGNKSFTAPTDPLVRVAQGPNGVTIQTLDGTTTTIVLSKTAITMTRGSASVVIKDGEVDINAATIKLNGIVWGTHEHTGVTAGGAKTGGPTGP